MSSATVTVTRLSVNDLRVLGALFDAEASLERGVNVKQPATTSTGTGTTTAAAADAAAAELSKESTIPAETVEAEKNSIRLLNRPSPSRDIIDTAISNLTAIIAAHPTYASAYVNRAQACRLLLPAFAFSSSEGKAVRHPASEDDSRRDSEILSLIISDLSAAIGLSSKSGSVRVGAGEGHTLAAAHLHRASLLLLASTSSAFRDLFTSLAPCASLPCLTAHLSAEKFEELASQDFAVAGRHGSEIGRDLSVRTNPYAKMCGAIVREAIGREVREYWEGQAI